MALKSRIVLGIATIMALSVVAVLPPRSCADVVPDSYAVVAMCGGWRYAPPITHQRALLTASKRLRRRLNQLALSDSVQTLVRAGRGVRSADGSIVVLYQAPLSADSARVWLNLAIGERDRVRGNRVAARLVVALETDTTGNFTWARSNTYRPRNAASRFVSVSGADTTCIVALRFDRNWEESMVAADSAGRYGSFLGWCGLVARYGAPGTSVGPAVREAFDNSWTYFPWSSVVRDRHERAVIADEGADYRLISCVKGDARACPAVLGLGQPDPELVDFTRVGLTRDFLGYLPTVKGPEAFNRFWHASGTAYAAMERSFGTPSALLVRDWAQQTFEVKRERDPLPRSRMALAAIGWLSAALTAAFAIGMRRQAGS